MKTLFSSPFIYVRGFPGKQSAIPGGEERLENMITT